MENDVVDRMKQPEKPLFSAAGGAKRREMRCISRHGSNNSAPSRREHPDEMHAGG